MNVASVEATTLPASTVQEVLMVMLLKIIVAPATMTVQMIVSKIVLVHGVVISYLMNAEFVVVMVSLNNTATVMVTSILGVDAVNQNLPAAIIPVDLL